MADLSNNDFDQFILFVNTAIEEGNPNILQKAIKEYTGKISQNYINMAINMYEQLVVEKIEDMEI